MAAERADRESRSPGFRRGRRSRATLMGSMVEFTRPDGQTAPGYLAPAAQTGAPGVVMLEEWWGVDDRIKATADRLASSGFRVLVPDLFRGRNAVTRDEATHLIQGLNFAD